MILLVHGSEQLRSGLRSLLHPCHVVAATDGRHALALIHDHSVGVVLLEVPTGLIGERLDLVRRIRAADRNLPTILIVARSSEEQVVAALRAGVSDYFQHPVPLEEVAASALRCLRERPGGHPQSRREVEAHREEPQLIGNSQQMRDLRAYLSRVAATDSNVLITGETGTGKELAARVIYSNSKRHHRPFICVNCAAIPDSLLESELFGYERGAFTGADRSQTGKLQMADGGTIFFDEIGDMSPFAQAKILRAVESREVYRLGARVGMLLDLRLIAATNRDLEQMSADGRFRSDLYFRLNVARVHLPPLRDRKEDIALLCEQRILDLSRRFGLEVEDLSVDVRECLLAHTWPGNVRELHNLLEAIFINRPSRRITLTDLPEHFRRLVQGPDRAPVAERDRLLSALRATNWNKSRAAAELHWSRMTLYRKMAKHQVIRVRELA